MKNNLLVLFASVILSTPLAVTAAQYGDFTYETDGSAITITRYTGAGDKVVIPGAINGLPVTVIGYHAFYFCTALTGVTIPDSVTSIGEGAFRSCLSLINVTIPDGVISIGYNAFFNCPNLNCVTIPGSVTSIGDGAFQGCYILTRVYFHGNAPGLGGLNVFTGDDFVIVHYLPGTTGWDQTFGGCPTRLWNPMITANGLGGYAYLDGSDTIAITVAMNAGNYAGTPVDWWIVASAGSSWYYLNSSVQWTQFDGNLSNCHPVYQGALFNLPPTEVLNITGLAAGSYRVWFAVDYPMDGILNLNGPILFDWVDVTVQ
jgi:hypothetical protein